jgi:hypothetical protein
MWGTGIGTRRPFSYNVWDMQKALITLTMAAVCLTGCNKSDNKTTAGPSRPADAVQAKLQELAGGGAKDCGRLKTQDIGPLQVASDCATQAAKDKKPFFVGYDLPGMTVAVAGNAQGQLFTVTVEGQPGEMNSAPCPSALRIAPSGRVTCFTPGSMGPGPMSPHGGVPAAQGGTPQMPPAGTPNPHASTPGPVKQH